MFKVKSIEWLCEEISEGEVEIEDKYIRVLCFSHPCTYNVGDFINEEISCFYTVSCEKSKSERYEGEHMGGYRHRLVGRITDKDKGLFEVCGS